MVARTRKQKGFLSDVILAHYGWREPMFFKDVWPDARLGLYCELYYTENEGDLGFDPEFPGTEKLATETLRLRNLNSKLHFDIAGVGISPTLFQAEAFPTSIRDNITVLHDGIDTAQMCPNSDAQLVISDHLTLSRTHGVVSFFNRKLEPYCGCRTLFGQGQKFFAIGLTCMF